MAWEILTGTHVWVLHSGRAITSLHDAPWPGPHAHTPDSRRGTREHTSCMDMDRRRTRCRAWCVGGFRRPVPRLPFLCSSLPRLSQLRAASFFAPAPPSPVPIEPVSATARALCAQQPHTTSSTSVSAAAEATSTSLCSSRFLVCALEWRPRQPACSFTAA